MLQNFKLASKFSPSYWDTTEEPTTSQYELFKKFDLFGEKEYKELRDYCQSIDMDFLSTPFDFNSADYLEPMMDIYKISSSDLSNIPFIEYMAKKNKPILLSIGASNIDEIDLAVKTIRDNNQQPLTLLHCVLEYPTPLEHANLNKIYTLKQKYPDVIIGYSDHTKPTMDCDVIKTAFSLGATVIEKHFTLDKTLTGNDHYHAMDPDDAKRIIAGLNFLKKIRGSYDLVCLESEAAARKNARRSIVTTCDIKQGETITRDMLTFKRPGIGIAPSKIDDVVGRCANKDLVEDTIMQEEYLD